MEMRKIVFDGLKWLALARVCAQLVRWIVTFIVISLLDPTDFGIAALALSVMGLFDLFTSFGLGASIVNTEELHTRTLKIIFGMIILVNSSLTLFLIAIAPFAASFYNMPELEAVLQVMSVSFLIAIFGVMSHSLLSRELKFKVLALADVCSGLAGAAVSLYMAYNGYGYWTLVIGGMSIMFTNALVKIIARPLWILPLFSFKEGKQYLTFGSLIMGSIILRYLYVNIDVIIAAKFWSPEVLGIYAVAIRVVVLPLNKVMPMIRQVAFPSYSKSQADLELVRGYLIKSTGLAMTICFPVFYGFSAIALLLIPLILGDSWREAALPIMLLSLVIPFRMLLELFEPALNATRKVKHVFLASLFILLAMLPVFFVAMPWEEIGLSVAWLLAFPALTVLVSLHYCKIAGLKFADLVRVLRTPFIVSLIMFFIVVAEIQLLSSVLNPYFLLGLCLLTGAASYAGLSWLMDRQQVTLYFKLLVRK